MSLQSHDVGELFSILESAYGSQWKHGVDAVQVWREALLKYDRRDVLTAAGKAIIEYPDYPPSLGQFAGVCAAARPRSVPKALERPKYSRSTSLANRIMRDVIFSERGMSTRAVEQMIPEKNRFAAKFPDPTEKDLLMLQSYLKSIVRRNGKRPEERSK